MTGSCNQPRANHDADAPSVQAGAGVEAISAVTLVTADMARAVRFYEALGFVRKCGGPQALLWLAPWLERGFSWPLDLQDRSPELAGAPRFAASCRILPRRGFAVSL